MAKKSKNNQHKITNKFTTNPIQYISLYNLVKYEHTYDRITGFITIKNIKEENIGVFNYLKLSEYLRVIKLN